MLAPIGGTMLLTQLFGSLKGGPSEAYNAWRVDREIRCIGHPAIDINAAIGTPIVAVKDGVVTLARDQWFGLSVTITDDVGGTYTYAHLSEADVPTGTHVHAGQTIGRTGNTGNSSGPHLHFAVRDPHPNFSNGFDGYIDPLPRFNADVYPRFDLSIV